MAENKKATFSSIMADLRARRFSNIYVLMGNESYYIDKITDFIAENALTEEERDFNQTIVYGADTNAAQIVDLARRYPMMAERQVVIVKEAQALRDTEPLAKYVQQPATTTILVLAHKNGMLDKRKSLYKAISASSAVVLESEKLKDWKLPEFIEKYLKEKGATIDEKSKQIIAESIGSDLNRLTSELDKLLISLPTDQRNITPEVVEKQIGVSKDFNIFELKDAIINRNIFKANQIVKYFNENPKAANIYGILPLLFNYFQKLINVYYAPQPDDPNSVAGWLGLKSQWAAKDYITGKRNYTGKKVMQIIHKIREVDAKSKGLDNASTEAEELLKELIFFILH